MDLKFKGITYTLPILLTAYMVVVSLASTQFYYSLPHKILLALVYGAFISCLYYFTLAFNRLSRPLGFLGAVGISTVLVWHLREQFLVPHSKNFFIACVIALALVYFLLVQLTETNESPRGLLVKAISLMVVFIVIFIPSLYLSNEFRWHILRGNTLLGTPTYYLLMPSVLELQNSMAGKYKKLESSEVGLNTMNVGAKDNINLSYLKESQPNIVFILVDTLRADVIRHYGKNPPLMPYLDELADNSVVFRNVIANSSWTRPSVASFFTGLLPEEHGARDRTDILASQHQTLAEQLHVLDYQTIAFVTNGAVGKEAGFSQGFDYFFELQAIPYVRAGEVVKSVLDWFSGSQRSEEKRLFLYIHLLDPHQPYLSGGEQRWGLPTPSAYNQELLYVDKSLRKLIPSLKEKLSEPLLIIVTSDHGEEFGEHGIYGHGHSLYEEVLQIPLILHSSDNTGGAILHDKLEARDFFDLIVGLAEQGNFSVKSWSHPLLTHNLADDYSDLT